jgi:hypothetical protein
VSICGDGGGDTCGKSGGNVVIEVVIMVMMSIMQETVF